jgi:hypothetical protein
MISGSVGAIFDFSLSILVAPCCDLPVEASSEDVLFDASSYGPVKGYTQDGSCSQSCSRLDYGFLCSIDLRGAALILGNDHDRRDGREI